MLKGDIGHHTEQHKIYTAESKSLQIKVTVDSENGVYKLNRTSSEVTLRFQNCQHSEYEKNNGERTSIIYILECPFVSPVVDRSTQMSAITAQQRPSPHNG